jgi:serine protease AprX
MTPALAVSWEDSKKTSLLALVVALVLSTSLVPVAAPDGEGSRAPALVSVIVREQPGAGTAPEDVVRRLGGTIDRRLPIIDGFVSGIPRRAIDHVRRSPGVLSISLNRRVELYGDDFNPITDPGSLRNTARAIGADDYYADGFKGAGVDVAIIDSGVVPVEGLRANGRLINGPDLSLESQDPELRYMDTFGHGTHMAGIIAGHEPAQYSKRDGRGGPGGSGIAPQARLVSIKVADAIGATDVSQVIAAIDWVVQHRNDNGMNIRVLNLSFGTDGTQNPEIDPLSHAVKVAWAHGIVVVVAAGNRGFGSPKLNNPAINPSVIAVGADDTKGTPDVSDDTIPEFSSRGDDERRPDVLAPGKSIVSFRNPGSFVDVTFPGGAVTSHLFRGTGTSQAAAVVSGAAALIIQQRPEIGPEGLKALLMKTASPLPVEDPGQGAGLINLAAAKSAPTPSTGGAEPPSPDGGTGTPAPEPGGVPTDPAPEAGSEEPSAPDPVPMVPGSGSLELARGTGHLQSPDGEELIGEVDIFGVSWDGPAWAAGAQAAVNWSGGMWRGSEWTGSLWEGSSWALTSWQGTIWSRNSWSGAPWSRDSWSRNSWSNGSWQGDVWARNSWSGDSWARNSWSSHSWR